MMRRRQRREGGRAPVVVVVVVLLEGTQPPRAHSRRSPRFEAHRSLLLLPSPLPLSEPPARGRRQRWTRRRSRASSRRRRASRAVSPETPRIKAMTWMVMVMWRRTRRGLETRAQKASSQVERNLVPRVVFMRNRTVLQLYNFRKIFGFEFSMKLY